MEGRTELLKKCFYEGNQNHSDRLKSKFFREISIIGREKGMPHM